MTDIVLGVNKGKTAFGKRLRDGGAALMRDGELLGAIAEERLSRRKHDGGYTLAARSLLECFNIRPSEVDRVVVSTCCEAENVGDVGNQFPKSEVISCNHHLSHGFGSFIPSGFDRAIVVVLDGGGNVVCANSSEQWWAYRRDQQTYFLGHGHTLEVLDRDFQEPGEAGIGEIYRGFTYFLGWDSSRRAGNVMSLAAYGDPGILPKESLIWIDADGRMRSAVKCTPLDPHDMAASVLVSLGLEVPARRPSDPITQAHCNIAAWLQSEVENAILAKVRRLVRQSGIRQVCLAGGAAYNCRAIGRLMRSQIAECLYVGPAAGDQGQCIGNAIYGTIKRNASWKIGHLSPYIGLPRQTNVRDIIDVVAAAGPDLAVIRPSDCVKAAAQRLASGAIGAVFQGRSEFGLRALGNRSIIALPTGNSIRWRLNMIKDRNLFMPFAPIITADSAHRYVVPKDDLPYMTAAVDTTELLKQIAAAVVHVDGTSRVQTVREEQCRHLFHLLKEVERITGHPVLLNTSFNKGGQPIVESVADAVDAFRDLDLDFLWIDDVLVKGGRCPKSLRGVTRIDRIELYGTLLHEVDLAEIIKSPSSFNLPEKVVVRDIFMLFSKYVELFKAGRKATTVRYRKGAIDLPRRTVLPLYASASFLRDAKTAYVGVVRVASFKILPFGELNDTDAVRDGFASLAELRQALTDIYGQIAPEELVTIYSISQLASGDHMERHLDP